MKTCCDWECAEANFCQVGGIKCERCDEVIKGGDKYAIVKWKKYRKKGIYLVCESCAEGIMKEFESEVRDEH